jgi:TolB-like protein/Flp pilus assembly protein TadD
MNWHNFLAELKRRNVYKAAAAYAVVSWLLIQVATQVFPFFEVPNWAVRLIVLLLILGFPAALIFSWAFEITPEGIKRESEIEPSKSIARKTGRKLVATTVVLAVIAGGLFVFQWVRPKPTDTTNAAMSLSAAAAPRKSIAILPFSDLSPNHDQESFSDGMAEEILNALARIKDLKVIGRSSSFFYKGKNVSLKQIGSELGVANILEGSIRKQGEQVRITSALSRTADGLQVWSKNYDGTLANIFDLQESFARDIAGELNVALADPSEARIVDKPTDNTQAYALFIEAQTLVSQRVGDSLPRAIALLQQATRLDPNFARAWGKLAVALAVEPQYAAADWRTNWAAAEPAARRAIEIDPKSAEAYAALGYIDFSRRRYVQMVEPAQRAIEIDPNDLTANFWMANQLAATGRTAEAEAVNDRALKVDPGNALLVFYKALLRWRAGDMDTATKLANRVNSWRGPLAGTILAEYAAKTGDHNRGAAEFARGFGAFRSGYSRDDLVAIYHGVFGDEAARKAALAVVARHPGDDINGTMLLMLAEPEQSFADFEHSNTGLSDGYLNWLWLPNNYSRKARQHPAFQGFAKRIGLVDYWKQNRWPDLCQPAPDKGPDTFTCQ